MFIFRLTKRMKTIILCGGEGTRLKEETEFRPKSMVLIGGKPILWHIMKTYSNYGFNEFILTLGYKGDMIKDYFLNHRTYSNDFTLDTKTNEVKFHKDCGDDFKITFVETGPKSLTGERVRLVKDYITDDHFMLTYGDGVANINIKDLLNFHLNQKTAGTITGVNPTTRFGVVSMDEQSKKAHKFHQFGVVEDAMDAEAMNKARQSHISEVINGGFMVFKRDVLDRIKPDSMIEEMFVPLAKEGQLSVYKHDGMWRAMDTYKDVEELNTFWRKDPFWKVWK